MIDASAWLVAGTGAVGYVVMGLLVLAGACLQGVGGIGFAMFAAPIAALSFPALVPGPLLLLGGLVSAMAAVRERHAVDWPLARRCIVGRCLGALLAAVLMVLLSPRALGIGFALLLLAGVALSVAGRPLKPTAANALAAGTLSGVMGTITSAGAPPLGLLTQSLPPAAIRSTVGAVIAVGAAASIALLAVAGQFTLRHLVLGLALLPWIAIGFALSGRIAARVSPRRTRQLLLGLVAAGALTVLAKALFA